jgi:hypothetical protein
MQLSRKARWTGAGFLAFSGLLTVLWSGYRAAYALWLNAHPLYDDAYWAGQFSKYFTVFAFGVVVVLVSLWWVVRLRRHR